MIPGIAVFADDGFLVDPCWGCPYWNGYCDCPDDKACPDDDFLV